ncbi:hypothetical protein NQ117_17590 [Paenibacillus sp. SC116]|nr:hypothetical protein [Paenibacillus sp. SC116]
MAVITCPEYVEFTFSYNDAILVSLSTDNTCPLLGYTISPSVTRLLESNMNNEIGGE